MNLTPEHILIVGNGFDLNLGLKTSYCDFLNSEQFQLLLYNDNDLALHLSGRHKEANWIDIEIELKRYSANEQTHAFEVEYYALCAALMEYLTSLQYKMLDDSKAFELLEKYKNENFLILDFNYTKTTQILLEMMNFSLSNINDRIVKIHGSAKTKNIIFGVEDGARIKREHIFLKKSFHPSFQPVNFKSVLKEATTISFFGHSLGETDHMYFNDFFYSAASGYEKCTMDFFYYGNEGYKNMFMEIDELTNHKLSGFRQHNQVTFTDCYIK